MGGGARMLKVRGGIAGWGWQASRLRPRGAYEREIDSEFGPIESDFVIGEQDADVDEHRKACQHGGEKDRGKAGPDAGEEGEAGGRRGRLLRLDSPKTPARAEAIWGTGGR